MPAPKPETLLVLKRGKQPQLREESLRRLHGPFLSGYWRHWRSASIVIYEPGEGTKQPLFS